MLRSVLILIVLTITGCASPYKDGLVYGLDQEIRHRKLIREEYEQATFALNSINWTNEVVDIKDTNSQLTHLDTLLSSIESFETNKEYIEKYCTHKAWCRPRFHFENLLAKSGRTKEDISNRIKLLREYNHQRLILNETHQHSMALSWKQHYVTDTAFYYVLKNKKNEIYGSIDCKYKLESSSSLNTIPSCRLALVLPQKLLHKLDEGLQTDVSLLIKDNKGGEISANGINYYYAPLLTNTDTLKALDIDSIGGVALYINKDNRRAVSRMEDILRQLTSKNFKAIAITKRSNGATYTPFTELNIEHNPELYKRIGDLVSEDSKLLASKAILNREVYSTKEQTYRNLLYLVKDRELPKESLIAVTTGMFDDSSFKVNQVFKEKDQFIIKASYQNPLKETFPNIVLLMDGNLEPPLEGSYLGRVSDCVIYKGIDSYTTIFGAQQQAVIFKHSTCAPKE